MSQVTNLSKDFELLKEAVLKAGEIAMGKFGSGEFKSWLKDGNEPVTEIDLEVNKSLKEMLIGARPDYGWLSEESTDDKARLKKEFVWVVDPIDGTRAYINGTADFSISVALLENNIPVLGVIFAPALEKFYEAAKGSGCFLNGEKVEVSRAKNLAGMRLQSDPGYIGNTPRWHHPWPDINVSKFQSFALRLAAFSAGEADAVLAARPKSEWDIAAGSILIAEAGGILCDQNGEPFAFNQEFTRLHQIVAVTSPLKEEFLKIVNARISKSNP